MDENVKSLLLSQTDLEEIIKRNKTPEVQTKMRRIAEDVCSLDRVHQLFVAAVIMRTTQEFLIKKGVTLVEANDFLLSAVRAVPNVK
jgi:hypothetical protein